MLTDIRSIASDDTNAPSRNTIVLAILVHNIFSAPEVPAATCMEKVPSSRGHTYNSCSYALRAPNTVWCFTYDIANHFADVMEITFG